MRLKAIYRRLRQSVGEDGLRATCGRVTRKLRSRFGGKAFKRAWKITPAERARQEARVFKTGACISILTPVYNTPCFF